MNIPDYVNEILDTLKEAGYAAYVVGGCVRDYFLGARPQDYDIATSATPEQVLILFPKTVPTGLKHGTITVLSSKGACEVTTFRVDGPYEDSRRPKYVQFSQTIEEDLARRDFTINAIAFDGERYIDPFQGRADILHKLIRAVGHPAERLQEDALRILRAVRFAAQLNFTIEANTKVAITEYSHLLKFIAAERIRDELCKLLLSSHPGYGIMLMQELGLVDILLPELFTVKLNQIIAVMKHTQAQLPVRLAALINDSQTAQKILKRLRFSRQMITLVTSLLREMEHAYVNWEQGHTYVKWGHLEIKKMMNRIGVSNVELLFQLQLARAKAGLPSPTVQEIIQLREKVHTILAENQPLTVQDLAITGQDLIQLGLPQGPEIGKALHTLLDLVLADPSFNRKEALLNFAKRDIRNKR